MGSCNSHILNWVNHLLVGIVFAAVHWQVLHYEGESAACIRLCLPTFLPACILFVSACVSVSVCPCVCLSACLIGCLSVFQDLSEI